MATRLFLDVRRPARERVDIYDAVIDTRGYNRNYQLTPDKLMEVSRCFQIAVQWQRDRGDFMPLRDIVENGKGGMCAPIFAYDHSVELQGRKVEAYYGKTAGDMLQSFWGRDVPHTHQFGHNASQARICDWL